MKVITQNDIKKINKLYCELKTYAAVSRATGFSPATVKKYIINGYTPVDEEKIKRFNEPLPDFDSTIFRKKDWGDLCTMTDGEFKEIMELWEELEV